MDAWPFAPRIEMIEELEWLTDLFMAKGGEQRTAIRINPRRTMNFSHLLGSYDYVSAIALMRKNQGSGFYVPDWPASVELGAASGTINVPDGFPLKAMVRQSIDQYEVIDVVRDPGGDIGEALGSYTNARLIPVYTGYCPEGLSNDRGAAGINICSAAFTIYDTADICATEYPQYRGHDVVEDCPVVGAGTFSESIDWPLSVFDNQASAAEYLRSRTIPDVKFEMRWHEFTAPRIKTLIKWLYSRRGRQKAFWISSRGKDLEPVGSIAGTNLTIYSRPGLSSLAGIDVSVDGQYRQVTAVTPGTSVGGRDTLDLTIATLTNPDIKRISFLRCARFDSDRIELLHRAAEGTAVRIPCIEIPVP
jgi:hypothetical protein